MFLDCGPRDAEGAGGLCDSAALTDCVADEAALAFFPRDARALRASLSGKVGLGRDPDGNATDDAVAERLQEVDGDLSRDEITQAMESMNHEQQDALVALFWIGRDWEFPVRVQITVRTPITEEET